MEKAKSDLESVEAQVVAHCEAKQIGIFRGYVDPDNHEIVDWDTTGGDLSVFLSAAARIGVRLLYLDVFRFSADEIENDPDDSEDEDGPGPGDSERRSRLETFRSRLGEICSVTVMFRLDGLFHSWSESARWFDEFCEIRDESDDSDEEGESDEDDENVAAERSRIIMEVAGQLAHDPRFPQCRTQAARLALLRRVRADIDKILPTAIHRTVVQEAQAIFDLDIRPKT